MATYLELFDVASSPTSANLKKKLRVAVAIKAQAIAASPTPTPAQREWARSALATPQEWDQTILNYVLAANATLTTTQIENATDAAVQTAVNNAVDTLLGV